MKKTIKDRAGKLWAVMDALHSLGNHGYYLKSGNVWDDAQGKFMDDKFTYTIDYNTPDGPVKLYHDTVQGDVVSIAGYAGNGKNLIVRDNPLVADALVLLGQDRTLYDLVKNADIRYDGRMRIRQRVWIKAVDTVNYQDGQYIDTNYTLNRKGQVFASKPVQGSRNVYVAMGID